MVICFLITNNKNRRLFGTLGVDISAWHQHRHLDPVSNIVPKVLMICALTSIRSMPFIK